jgi:hypothetical protein
VAWAASLALSALAAVSWFHSPSGNISCEVASKRGALGTYASCQTVNVPRSVTLRADGTTKVCNGVGCLGNGPTTAFTLAYGKSVVVGPFTCASLRSGMRCIVTRTGRGFLISRAAVKRL